MSDLIDLRAADAQYRSPPTFVEWADASVNAARLERYLDQLDSLGGASPDLLKGSLRVVSRAAAIDTGAIEKLYEVDRGFTLTVAAEVASWQAVLEAKGTQVLALIQSQLEAYDYVLDFATGKQGLAEAWIRQLHSVICAAQESYGVVTSVGVQQQPLPKGTYKLHANHVLDRHGKLHSYAPVDVTPTEVNRLVSELRGSAFLSAHPVLQASYAHYALVVIHPFADGNGRVARALASVPTYRAYRVPLLILAQRRVEYIESLEAADRGEHQVFVDFVFERTLDALQLAYESLRTAAKPEAQESFDALVRLYITKAGLTHNELDNAASRLLGALERELAAQSAKFVVNGQITATVDRYAHVYNVPDSSYRGPLDPAKVPGVRLILVSAPPAAAQIVTEVQAEVPKDAGGEDDLILRNMINQETKDTVAVRVNETFPDISDSARMRLTIFAERVLRQTLDALLIDAQQVIMQQGGYRISG
jgi:Fic family protein